jgi:hypothetical protein
MSSSRAKSTTDHAFTDGNNNPPPRIMIPLHCHYHQQRACQIVFTDWCVPRTINWKNSIKIHSGFPFAAELPAARIRMRRHSIRESTIYRDYRTECAVEAVIVCLLCRLLTKKKCIYKGARERERERGTELALETNTIASRTTPMIRHAVAGLTNEGPNDATDVSIA